MSRRGRSAASGNSPSRVRDIMEASNIDQRLAALQRRIEELDRVCAEADQFAGTVGAPERVLDNLSAAAEGQAGNRRHRPAALFSRGNCPAMSGGSVPVESRPLPLF